MEISINSWKQLKNTIYKNYFRQYIQTLLQSCFLIFFFFTRYNLIQLKILQVFYPLLHNHLIWSSANQNITFVEITQLLVIEDTVQTNFFLLLMPIRNLCQWKKVRIYPRTYFLFKYIATKIKITIFSPPSSLV